MQTGQQLTLPSLSSWRAWIEIARNVNASQCNGSLSSWRAWIEMSKPATSCLIASSRSPHGERGLKLGNDSIPAQIRVGRSPHGERGLKYSSPMAYVLRHIGSLSSWRAWIEIMGAGKHFAQPCRRSPHGERGLKFVHRVFRCWPHASLSSWRAWIEMEVKAR